MKNKKILVTGGAGFIGANLIRKLVSNGYKPHLLLRRTSDIWRLKDLLEKTIIVNVDILNANELNRIIHKINPNIIYHFAAYGAYSYQDEAEKILDTNINGTLNLLNACKDLDKLELFVNTGSSSEYGFKLKPMAESEVLEPNSYYAIAKAAQTHLCNYFAKSFNLPIVTLRPFSVYGPYEEIGRLIPNMMVSFYKKSKLKMVSKKIVRDFVYIEDYIDVCLKINTLKKYQGEVFNIGSGIETNFDLLIKTFQEVAESSGKVIWGSNQGKKWDTTRWQADITKSSKLLDFHPKYDLKLGLQKSWEWFKTNHQLYENS